MDCLKSITDCPAIQLEKEWPDAAPPPLFHSLRFWRSPSRPLAVSSGDARPELVVKLLAVPAGHHTVWIWIDGQERYSSTKAQLLGFGNYGS